MSFRSHNPVFSRVREMDGFTSTDYETASYKGVTTKTLIFLGLTVLGAVFGIMLLFSNPTLLSVLLTISGITTFIFGLVAMISPKSSKLFGSLYCLSEGMLVGVVSLLFEAVASGAIMAALVSTFTVVLVVTVLFTSGLVKVNSTFTRILMTISISVIISQFILLIFSWTGVLQYSFRLQFGISLIMIIIASMYLMFDMQNIVNIVEGGFPKEFEWYAAFGLIFTIIWIYMEVLPIVARFIGSSNN